MKFFLTVIYFAFLVSSSVLAAQTNPIQVDVLVKTTSSWDGSKLPKYPKGQPEITVMKVIIPPYTKLPLHKHPVISAGVILKGELTIMTKSGDTLYFKAGDSVAEVVNTWHYGVNDGYEPVELIVFYAGIEGTALSISK